MEDTVRKYECRIFVSGKAQGEALVIRKPLSFFGEVDSLTGAYLVDPKKEIYVADKILIIPHAIGSAGSSRVLMQLARRRRKPKGIICLRTPDTILTEGAILARIPLVCCENAKILEEVEDNDLVLINDENRQLIVRSAKKLKE